MFSLEEFRIEAHQSLREALIKIDQNLRGICFVTKTKRLVGLITDGDARRFLLDGGSLEQKVEDAMNSNCVALPVWTEERIIRSTFSSQIKIIPLHNSEMELVDFADSLGTHRIPIAAPSIGVAEERNVLECLRTNWISSQGRFVTEFEKRFESMHPGMHALSVSNGTTALHLALASLGIKAGDEVIVPDITFAASANAVIHCGASPVFCEIKSSNGCIDVAEAEKLITPRTKAIMAVHLYGDVCDLDELDQLAKNRGLFLVEDCAESLGSKYHGFATGTFGDAATFSFFGNKTITTGEGGMVLFRDAKAKNRAKMLRDHGMSEGKRYWHDVVGYNYRLTNLQAAIGVAQLEKFEEIISRKIEIQRIYNNKFSRLSGATMKLPSSSHGNVHSNWLYTFTVTGLSKEKMIADLLDAGVEARPAFQPLHKMPPYQAFRKSASLNNSIEFSKSSLSLPSFIGLSDDKINLISDLVISIVETNDAIRLPSQTN